MLIQKILLLAMLVSAIWYACESLAPELIQAAKRCELE